MVFHFFSNFSIYFFNFFNSMNCSKHAAIHFSVCTTCKIDLYLPRYRNGAGGERAWSHSEPAIDGRILLSDTRLAELAGGSYFMQLR